MIPAAAPTRSEIVPSSPTSLLRNALDPLTVGVFGSKPSGSLSKPDVEDEGADSSQSGALMSGNALN